MPKLISNSRSSKPILVNLLLIITFLLIFSSKDTFSQSIIETKLFITDMINNYGHNTYKLYGTYGSDLTSGDLKKYFDISGHDLSRILITERCLIQGGICVTNFFDIKGIESIYIIKDQDYLVIRLKIATGYLSVEEVRTSKNTIAETKTVDINFGLESKEQADKLKKALINLSKQYGGQPRTADF